MIEIKPNLKLTFRCPECNCSDITVSRLVFPGIRILADCSCFCCEGRFFADLPVGHALYYPKYLVQKTGMVYPSQKKMDWFTHQLWESYKNRVPEQHVSIRKKVYKETGREAVILNCLDYLYGHSLLKLFNADGYIRNQPGISLILILPASFEWLIPPGVAEVWLVELGLSKLKSWYDAIDAFVQQQLSRFEKVYLSPAYSHPDPSKILIEDYSKVSPFDLEKYSALPKQLAFIYREDRLWHGSPWEEFLFLNLSQIKSLSLLKKIFIFFQNIRIKAFFRMLRKEMPELRCVLVGLGNTGSFPAFVEDKRVTMINADLEKEWCNIYASSHLVVGIHGSNMLLPSAHAGGFLEILPESRIGNMTQDIFPRHDHKLLLYLGRHVSSSLSPRRIARQARAIIKGFPVFQLYNAPEFLPYEIIKNPQEFSKEFKLRTEEEGSKNAKKWHK